MCSKGFKCIQNICTIKCNKKSDCESLFKNGEEYDCVSPPLKKDEKLCLLQKEIKLFTKGIFGDICSNAQPCADGLFCKHGHCTIRCDTGGKGNLQCKIAAHDSPRVDDKQKDLYSCTKFDEKSSKNYCYLIPEEEEIQRTVGSPCKGPKDCKGGLVCKYGKCEVNSDFMSEKKVKMLGAIFNSAGAVGLEVAKAHLL